MTRGPDPGRPPGPPEPQHETTHETTHQTTQEVAQEVMAELTDIRRSIDNIDVALVHLLAERFKCTQRVGRLKAEHGLPPADPLRESEQIATLRAHAEAAHLDPAFAEKFLAFVIDEVIRHHRAIAADPRPRAAPAPGARRDDAPAASDDASAGPTAATPRRPDGSTSLRDQQESR